MRLASTLGLGSMRDRRNTNLSISSLTSNSTVASPVLADSITAHDTAEKGRYLWIGNPEGVSTAPGKAPLPSPLLKHAREGQQSSLLSRCDFRVGWKKLVVIAGLVLLLFYRHSLPLPSPDGTQRAPLPESDRHFNLVPDYSQLPLDPMPVAFHDSQGMSRWTVSIPQSLSFPLRPHQYRELAQACEALSKSLGGLGGARSRIMGRSMDKSGQAPYYAVDKAFMDVAEAEDRGILPRAQSRPAPITVVEGPDAKNTSAMPGCEKSLTFVLETDNAGLGNSLLSLWLSYGLAKKEGRAFFVDDSNWAYGTYTHFFPAPPQPLCAPPPPHRVLPFPHSAQHLLVSAATAPWTFGSSFTAEFTNTRKHGVSKNKPIFDLLRTGYEDLFQLVGDDAAFLDQKLALLAANAESTDTPVVGMHIRRGDRHPFELEFSNDYIPFERYTSAAAGLFSGLAGPPNTTSDSPPPTFLLASDDPDVLTSPDLLATLPVPFSVSRAQDRIVLASKKNLAPAVPLRDGAYTKHVDENSGWEGGFYAALFSALGNPHPSYVDASTSEGIDEHEAQLIRTQARGLRQLVGRAYLLDLAVLGHADAVVCAASSAACRVLGVVMGWERVRSGMWVNVDAGRSWSWDGA